MIYVPWLPLFWTLLARCKRILCYDLPAVDVNNHNIHERYQHTHTCHYVPLIVPVFIRTDKKPIIVVQVQNTAVSI